MPLCFDLDGTLGSFRGGYGLLREALGQVWGETPSEDALRRCQGSTDWEIVDELHHARFGSALDESGYAAYENACLARFEQAFQSGGREPVLHRGLLEGLRRLVEEGHPVWLVSGNTPRILAFKARLLGVDARIAQLGSLPRHSRAELLARAMAHGPSPHLYVGDRPHDREAARHVGVPFLGVGPALDATEHPLLSVDAAAEALVAAVCGLV